jgi:hypothetical protein
MRRRKMRRSTLIRMALVAVLLAGALAIPGERPAFALECPNRAGCTVEVQCSAVSCCCVYTGTCRPRFGPCWPI